MIIEKIEYWLKKAFLECFQEQTIQIALTVATQERFGHYQCNNAMAYGAEKKIVPRVVAQSIRDYLEKEAHDFFEKIEVAGPGFINFWIKNSVMIEEMGALWHSLDAPKSPAIKKKIIIDFSSPNIAKEMHVGHLRSTIIGESLARILEWQGHEVLRLNHVGDWGTSFGMLLAYIQKKAIVIEESFQVAQLSQYYKEAKALFDTEPSFKKEAQHAVLALQAGDLILLDIWNKMNRISEAAYQEIYDLLDVSLCTRGESFYNALLPEVLKDAEQSGHLVCDQGAQCLFFEGIEVPFMLQKSDGGYNYDTTDLAAFKHRVQVEKADQIIIVVDLGQAQHFDLLGRAAQLLGYWDPRTVQFDYVSFGLVLGPDHKKFKTRSGHSEKLVDVLYAGIAKARDILEERAESKKESPAFLEERARVLGINAIKYADLSVHRQSDYVFSYEKMLSFEGNTAAFLMYSLVRIKSILRRVGREQDFSTACFLIVHPAEQALVRHMLRFEETIQSLLQDLCPHRLADYLYRLAEYFNGFFRDCPVDQGGEYRSSRILLCLLCEKIFDRGFFLLGLQQVEVM